MNKILPIILVVVLSGCSSGPKEYSCKTKKGEQLYLMINEKEMIVEIGTNRRVAKIFKNDDISIFPTKPIYTPPLACDITLTGPDNIGGFASHIFCY